MPGHGGRSFGDGIKKDAMSRALSDKNTTF
jgi:hypothetical protein